MESRILNSQELDESQWVSQLWGYEFQEKLRSALRGAGYCIQAWRRVAIYSSPPRTVWGSRRVKCPDKCAVATCSNIDSHFFVIKACIIVHVFPWRMATRDVRIPEFWVSILSAYAVLDLWSRPHTLRIYSSVCTKKLPDVQLRICRGYIRLSHSQVATVV